jgi:hypothetical protein
MMAIRSSALPVQAREGSWRRASTRVVIHRPNVLPLSCKPPKRPSGSKTAAPAMRRGSGAVRACVGGTRTTTASPEGLQPRASLRRLASFCGELAVMCQDVVP